MTNHIIRTGLNKNLGFAPEDREENIRRVAEVGKLFADSGVVALCSFVSPFKKDRELARELHKQAGLPFYEIYVATSLEECEKRDVKGLYKKARAGLIKGFTGIDQVYEEPDQPELTIRTEGRPVADCVQEIVEILEEHSIVPRSVVEKVVDLTVPEDELEAATAEAESLPSVEIGKYYSSLSSVLNILCVVQGRLIWSGCRCWGRAGPLHSPGS